MRSSFQISQLMELTHALLSGYTGGTDSSSTDINSSSNSSNSSSSSTMPIPIVSNDKADDKENGGVPNDKEGGDKKSGGVSMLPPNLRINIVTTHTDAGK